MSIELVLRITGVDFCAGALFAYDGQAMRCVRAAPKLEALEGMDEDKATRRCKAMGFAVERLQPYDAFSIDLHPEDQQHQARLRRELGRFGL